MSLDSLEEKDMQNGSAGKKQNLTLIDAWQVFADYDHNANLAGDRFGKLRYWILVLGVIATAFAVFYEVVMREQIFALFPPDGLFGGLWNPSIQSLGKFIVLLLPMTVAGLLTWTNKFGRGKSWILLRGAAESIKREIFLFRAKVDIYNDAHHFTKSREVRLAEKIKQINERLMKTEVNKDGLEIYDGDLPPLFAAADGDDGFTFIYPDEYLSFRLENQMNWYKGKVEKLGKKNGGLNIRIIVIGIIGTMLAAVGFEVWVAVTTAIAAAIASFLEYNQYEDNLTSYNQTGRDLESLRMWWRAVPDIEKEQHIIYERLVTNAEKIMSSEHSSWIQNMQDALEELYEEDKQTEEEMLEIIERFQNDPDASYFVDEDDDYISAEELDAMGFDMSGGGSNGHTTAIAPTAAETGVADNNTDSALSSFTTLATDKATDAMASYVDDHKDEAVDFLTDTIKDKAEDLLGNFVGDEMADSLLDSLDDMIDEKTSEIVDSAADKATDLAEDFLDDKVDEYFGSAKDESTDLAEDFLDEKADDFLDSIETESGDHLEDFLDNKVDDLSDSIAPETTDQLDDLFNDLDDKSDNDPAPMDVGTVAPEATDQLNDLFSGLDDKPTNDPAPEPMDIESDMLSDLFGDISEDDEDDDLSDLFGDG